MRVEDLIRELEKLPGHWPVGVQRPNQRAGVLDFADEVAEGLIGNVPVVVIRS